MSDLTFILAQGVDPLAILTSPVVRFLLLSFTLFAIYTSIKLAGSGVPEGMSLILLSLLLVPPLFTGHAQWFELLICVAGVALLAVEIFILPGFGVAGFTGLALLVGGLILTFLPPLDSNITARQIFMASALVLGALVIGTVKWFVIAPHLAKIPYFNRMMLKPNAGSEVGAASVSVTQQIIIGATGVAKTPLRPGGTATFVGADWKELDFDVVCDRGFVETGQHIVVVDVEGTRVLVRPLKGA